VDFGGEFEMSDLHLAWLVIVILCVGIIWSFNGRSVMSDNFFVWVPAVFFQGLAVAMLGGFVVSAVLWAIARVFQ
jgi:hypothetical protein